MCDTKKSKSAQGAIDLIAAMVRGVVDAPDAVAVTAEGTVISVSVPSSDLGKVIGNHGRMARCLRTLLSCYSKREKTMFSLNIMRGNR